jgi:hypothetical protein
MEVTPVKAGDAVLFFDEYGKEHDALVTAVHGWFLSGQNLWGEFTQEQHDKWLEEYGPNSRPPQVGFKVPAPSINVVFITDDATKHDPYGNQVERRSSVTHKSNQPAFGMYWMNH